MPTKHRYLLPLLVIGQLVLIVVLLPANCRHKTVGQKLSDPKCVEEIADAGLPKLSADGGTTQSPNVADSGSAPHQTIDMSVQPDAARACVTAKDCGCGYWCVGGECYKSDLSCCTDADCKKPGDFCSLDRDGQNGTCVASDCGSDTDCGKCGSKCLNRLCVKLYCCADSECAAGEYCNLNTMKEGVCLTSECSADTDCGNCERICDDHRCRSGCNANQPCCGTDICYRGNCWGHEYIENGHCLDNSHCPAGKVCVDNDTCLPETCTDNASCGGGCEVVCRDGQCKRGCEKDSDCCHRNEVCNVEADVCMEKTQSEDN